MANVKKRGEVTIEVAPPRPAADGKPGVSATYRNKGNRPVKGWDHARRTWEAFACQPPRTLGWPNQGRNSTNLAAASPVDLPTTWDGHSTIYELFEASAKKYADKP